MIGTKPYAKLLSRPESPPVLRIGDLELTMELNHDTPQRGELRKPWTNEAISSAAVSNAK
jgi:hypothetical protein